MCVEGAGCKKQEHKCNGQSRVSSSRYNFCFLQESTYRFLYRTKNVSVLLRGIASRNPVREVEIQVDSTPGRSGVGFKSMVL
jgi:hypothetical protein